MYLFLLAILSLAAASPIVGDQDDISWRALSDLVGGWAKEQTPEDQKNLGAFYDKIVKIYERFNAVLEENQDRLSPEAGQAFKEIIKAVNDEDNGLREKIEEVGATLQALPKEERGHLVEFVVIAIGEYGKKYGNPLLGKDSILGKQT
uniref:DUF148 domain-containing protein n=1 Tax=Steinernema glaseri TaxID=37863 RepID=A0A1I8AUC7_9BILA